MPTKKISVICTCFNLEKYLDECIESVKQQILEAYEIILVHDGCKETAKAYTGVTTVFCDKNAGVVKARDIGFKISTGDHIIFFDGDDIMPFTYLMELNKIDADVVYPNCVVWAGWDNSGYKNQFHEAPHNISLEKLIVKNEVLMPSMFKREWYDKVGGFDPSLELFEDYDFWLKMLVKGATFAKSSTFMYYRQRVGSRNRQNDELKKEVYLKITERYRSYLKDTKKTTLKTKKDSKV